MAATCLWQDNILFTFVITVLLLLFTSQYYSYVMVIFETVTRCPEDGGWH